MSEIPEMGYFLWMDDFPGELDVLHKLFLFTHGLFFDLV